MNGNPTGQRCPYCEKGEIHVLSNGRMCGCDACHSLFRYPSMVPFPTAGTEEAGVQIVRSSFAGKVIATLEPSSAARAAEASDAGSMPVRIVVEDE